jgi:quercetin dioxygenase-like cupin family protein
MNEPVREHDLTPDELRAVAERFAADPARWSAHVAHDPTQRTYVRLLAEEHLEVWLLCWSEDHDTGFHDHDLSAGAVAVVAGEVREERLLLGRPPASRTLGAGESFVFGAADIHRVLHAGEAPAVTIHAYPPPLERMGVYVVEAGGVLQRHSVASSEELRPLEGAVS